MLGSHPMRVIYLVIFLIRKIIRIFSLIRIRNTGLMAVFLSRRASSEWWPPADVYTRGPNIPHPAIPHQGTTMSPYVHTSPSINFEQFSTLVSFLLLKTKFNLKSKKNKTSCLVGFWIVLVTVILDFIVAKIIFVLKNHILLTDKSSADLIVVPIQCWEVGTAGPSPRWRQVSGGGCSRQVG